MTSKPSEWRNRIETVLNLPFLRYYALAYGQSVPAWLSEISGISAKTLKKPIEEIRERTLLNGAKKSFAYAREQLIASGYSPDEADIWLNSHPGATMPGAVCSAVVYNAQIKGVMSFPHTIEFAIQIDQLSSRLFEARQRDDLEGFKSALLTGFVADSAYYFRSNAEAVAMGTPPLLEQLRTATAWSTLDEAYAAIFGNVLFSALAHWDVEFCSQFCSEYEPRPLFTLVLPRLDPALGKPAEGDVPIRKGMFRYPVRRLIDLMACVGESVRTGRWPDTVPKPKEIDSHIVLNGNALTNWRDGTKKFLLRDFVGLWKQLCTTRDGRTAHPLWPLFVAALMFQDLFVKVSATSRDKTVYFFEDDYMSWWYRHYEGLKAKGCAFGTTPWPNCFNEI